ncbi:MAG: argininosuccinate lyase [Chthoniobacterales bacterium]
MPETLWAKDLPLDPKLHAFTVGNDRVTDLELLPYDAEGSAAHARMLGECGLLEETEARALVAALRELQAEARRGALPISAEQEDGHTALEVALTQRLGPTGRRIHLARSRNDQVQTALRLFMRARLLDLGDALEQCAAAFLEFARQHAATPLPGYTHMRRAMPSNWGMWSAAFVEGLLEELEQLPALWARLDRCPLGAAAGFGSPVALDRERSAELLGFSRVQRNPIDVMNGRGRHEQALASWIASAAGTLEKAIWDLLLWSTEEFGFVRLPDAFTTGSSLMPQKRNPDVLELARGRCRELRGLTNLLGQLAGGLPSSYHRDHQLLKAPLIEITAKGEELFAVLAHLLPGLEINTAACAAACSQELYAAKEACRLAAEGMPFRDAYAEVARQLREGTFQANEAAAPPVELEAATAELQKARTWLGERRSLLAETTERLFAWP